MTYLRMTGEQKIQFDFAVRRHGENVYAIKNHLKKHYGYDDDESWSIIHKFSTPTLGDILRAAGDLPLIVEEDENNYVVTDLAGNVSLVGDEAKSFLASVDKLGMPRNTFRLFVEVSV